MGRNLTALLNGTAKERREPEPAEAGPGTGSEVGSAEGARRAGGEPRGAPAREPLARNAAPEPVARAVEAPRRVGTESNERVGTREPDGRPAGAADLSVVRVPPEEARSGAASDAEPSPAPPSTRAGGSAAPDPSERARAADAPAAMRVSRVESGARASEAHTDDDLPRPGDRLRMIGVERIRRGVFQPRRFFDQEALQELADSLKAQGMIQPVIVRPFGGAFELIAGERRWRAAQIAGLAEIPAIVREMEDRSVAAVSLIENIQREDLNPLEEAQALTRLCDEFGMTHAAVAESIGRSRASVSNLMRLLELHDEVKVLVDKGELDMGHARALLRVPKVDQPALAARVVKQGLTVRAVEKLIRTGVDKPAGTKRDSAPDPDIERLTERLSGVLGAAVSIRHKPGGSGRLEIRYGSLEELDGILAHIK